MSSSRPAAAAPAALLILTLLLTPLAAQPAAPAPQTGEDLELPGAVAPSTGQPAPPEPEPIIKKREVRLPDGTAVKYLVVGPPYPRRTVRYPLILAFAPADSSEEIGRATLQLYWTRPALRRDVYVVCPIGKRDMPYDRVGQSLLPDFLAAVLLDLPIDNQRVVFAGTGSGASAAYQLALSAPDRCAALVGLPLSLWDRRLIHRAGELASVPMYLRVGSDAHPNAIEDARQVAELVQAAGGVADFRTIPGQTAAIEPDMEEVMNWIFGVFRNRQEQAAKPQPMPEMHLGNPPPTPTPVPPRGYGEDSPAPEPPRR